MSGTSFAAIGLVNDTEMVEVYGLDRKKVVNLSIADLKEAWQRPLRW